MRLYIAGLLLALAFLLIYLPAIGHGFIKDDFRWIAESRVTSSSDLVALFQRNIGFYRPLVSASFAANYAVFGLNAFGYGITNLAVLLIDGALVFWLANRLTGVPEAALLAAVAWLFNFHGVNMALLWISGRTALLLCLFALGTAVAARSGRTLLAALLALAAMLCKEEAALLPLLFTVLAILDGSPRRYWMMWVALALYLALRVNSGAFGPQDAPPFYQFTFAPLALVRNVFEYLDRGATFAAAIAVALMIAARARPVFTDAEKRILACAAVWFVCFYALTVFVPVRSDLYALAPSIGSALAVAVVASAVRRTAVARVERCCVVLIVLVFLLIPIYRQRNERWVVPADLSASVLRTLHVATAGMEGGEIVLVDDPSARFTLDGSFGNLFGDAVHLALGPAWQGRIADEGTPARFVFVLQDGRLVAVPRR